ncbi:major facilitator superfamily protein [Sphingobium sp. SYK-6]|uniref:MFS transporter n=1 Tax=Sphingobium sp. (strain NBRC 103272 / SYK-6) TaxID=627192 RepID=UPI00022773CE|nr:MFS transporter [Sphingobium sp. SYK-6]BAK66544.1 major facilitator superfamily protein [Sphingobium sp. SYK-6]
MNNPDLSQTDHPGLPRPRRYAAIAALSVGTSLVVLDGALPSVALPTIARSLSIPDSLVVLVITIYQLVLLMSLLPLAAMGERIGYRTLYVAGMAGFCLASLLCFVAQSLPLLLVARILQAFGASAVLSVSAALVRATYPSKRLGQGIAINSIVVSASNAVAPTLGGAIMAVAPWPFLFASVVPLGLITLSMARFLPEPERRATPYDWGAAALCAATFGLSISGLELMVHASLWKGTLVLAAGIAIGAVFVRRELGRPDPILPLDLVRRPVIALSATGAFLAFVASMMILVALPFRLHHGFALSASQIGAMIAPWPGAIMLVAPVAGILSDRLAPSLMGSLGMACSTLGMITLALLPANPDWYDMAWRTALCGCGFALYTAPNARLILKSAPRDRAASAGGLISTSRLSGQVLGASMAAGLLATGSAGAMLAPWFAALLCLLAGMFSFARFYAREG